MYLNPFEIHVINPHLPRESISLEPDSVPKGFDSKFEECVWPSDFEGHSEDNLPQIPGINLYLADAAYDVLIENGVFPVVGHESIIAQD